MTSRLLNFEQFVLPSKLNFFRGCPVVEHSANFTGSYFTKDNIKIKTAELFNQKFRKSAN